MRVKPTSTANCVQSGTRFQGKLEAVDEQRHQEKDLGCVAAGKGMASFSPTDDARLLESNKLGEPGPSGP